MKKSLSEGKYGNGKGGFRIFSKAMGLSALLASTFVGCNDLAPRWDADLYIPVREDSFSVMSFLPVSYIPSGASARISFPPQRYDIPSEVGDVIRNLETDSTRHFVFYLTLQKKTAVTVEDTVFVSPDSSSAAYSNPGWILFPIKMEDTDTLTMDSVVVSQESIDMLKGVANSRDPLWIQTSGNIKNYRSNSVQVNPSDSVHANLSVAARVRVSISN